MSILRIRDKDGNVQEILAIKGDKGDTPVKGVDYFTEEDKNELLDEVVQAPDAAYELIETITIQEEVSSVARYSYPGGGNYKLEGCFIRASFPATTDKSGTVSVNYAIGNWQNNKSVTNYMFNPFNGGTAKKGFSEVRLEHGRWMTGSSACGANQSDLAYYYKSPVCQGEYGADDGYVESLTIFCSSGIPVGTVFEIWAVRASKYNSLTRIDEIVDAVIEELPDGGGSAAAIEITQTTGDSETAVMSQKAVTTELRKVFQEQEVVSVNLFDKNSTANRNGYIIQGAGFTPINGFTVTHPIKADEGTTYTFNIKKASLGGNAIRVAGCNAEGEYLNVNEDATDNGDDTATITIDGNFGCTHFMVNVCNADIDTVMVVKGSSLPSEYYPYDSWNEVVLEEDVKIAENLRRSSPLYGKKLSLNGDSICYGAGSTGGYGKMIADTYNMGLQNISASGGTIAAETYASDGTTKRHWVCRTIENMDTDADYIILEGGVNDAALGVALGTITPNLNSTLDDTTFYGAFESMLKQLLIRFPGKKVGYIAVHQVTSNFCVANDESTSCYYAAKKCCAKWGVPFLDLNISCPPFGMIANSDTEMMTLRQAYTYNGDGWHPNEEGYKIYYVPKIVKWLESL